MPAIVGIRRLSDVRDGQWIGCGDPMTEAEKRYSNRTSTLKSDHAHPP